MQATVHAHVDVSDAARYGSHAQKWHVGPSSNEWVDGCRTGLEAGSGGICNMRHATVWTHPAWSRGCEYTAQDVGSSPQRQEPAQELTISSGRGLLGSAGVPIRWLPAWVRGHDGLCLWITHRGCTATRATHSLVLKSAGGGAHA